MLSRNLSWLLQIRKNVSELSLSKRPPFLLIIQMMTMNQMLRVIIFYPSHSESSEVGDTDSERGSLLDIEGDPNYTSSDGTKWVNGIDNDFDFSTHIDYIPTQHAANVHESLGMFIIVYLFFYRRISHLVPDCLKSSRTFIPNTGICFLFVRLLVLFVQSVCPNIKFRFVA